MTKNKIEKIYMIKKKIIIFPLQYPVNKNTSSGIFVKKYADMLAKNDYNVSIFYNNFISLKKIRTLIFFFKFDFFIQNKVKNYHTHMYSPYFNYIKLKIDYYLSEQKLTNYIKRFGKPDLLVCHFSFPTGYTAKKLSDKYNIPFVIVEHSTGFFTDLYSKYQLKIIKQSLDSASFIFPVSNFLKNKIKTLTSNSNIKVIGNIVSDYFFLKKDKKYYCKTKFIIIAQLVEKKQIFNLLTIFKNIKQKYDFELSIVGEGPQEKKLKRYVFLNGLEKNIKFYGSLSNKKISKFLDFHDFLISCSKVETFGITIAEAMAKRVPVIILNSGGPKDFTNNFNSVTVDNFQNMEKVIERTIRKKKLFNEKKISLCIKRNFSEKVIFQKYDKIFKRIIQK